MKKIVLICDKCENQVEDGKAFKLSMFKERRSDPAGGSENWDYVADLCPNCLVGFADKMMKVLDKSWTKEQKFDFLRAYKVREE